MHQPVLILGAGINGAALARELALGGLPVIVADSADLAFGATARSSRLIHGGLRYLEYGEFDLVRESLAERSRLLRLAPHCVRPLRLFIPVSNRFGGLSKSVARFIGWQRAGGAARPEPPRGYWLVRGGLWLYDFLAGKTQLPKASTHRLDDPEAIPVNPARYRWLCSYYDAQIMYPERFVVALLADAAQAAAGSGVPFELYTYHRVALAGRMATIHASGGNGQAVRSLEPAAIVNATGAWVDHTLSQLHVLSRRLIGGTKGSHIVTSNERLRAALGANGLYAEADDGRPVFVLPFGASSLIGTTDLPFEGDPADAVASPAELEYLLRTVNALLPHVGLTASDIDLHYCGVRPLPSSNGAAPASITRRHWLQEQSGCAVPLFSVIGGKLTTCRSLAEQAAGAIRSRLGLPPGPSSRDRVIPGGESYPARADALAAEWRRLAGELQLSFEQVGAVWALCGTRTGPILACCGDLSAASIAGTDIPIRFARWVVRHEWVRRLADLVERRLMLLYDHRLSDQALRQLADLLVEEAVIPPHQAEAEVAAMRERLSKHFGNKLRMPNDRAKVRS